MHTARSQRWTDGSCERFGRATARWLAPAVARGARASRIGLLAPALALALGWWTTGIAQAEEVTPPVSTAAPIISREGEVGIPTPAIEERKLTTTSGTWSGTAPITYTYKWLSCATEGESCTAISGATGTTFTPTASYLGRALKVEVTATNAAGSASASARTTEVRALGGDAVSFGENDHTELGAGYKDDFEDLPVPVVGLSGVIQVAAGDESSFALLDTGAVRSFGDNDFGQLGDGEGGQAGENWHKQESNVTVTGLTGVKSIVAESDHAMALLENGTVETWGNNWDGEVGDGVYGNSVSEATPVSEMSKVIAIAAGSSSDYALLSNHTVMAWGENTNGQLGIGEIGPDEHCHEKKALCSPLPHEVGTPVLNGKGEVVKNEKGEPEITPLTHVVAISAGVHSAYALLEDGHVMAWGANTEGQLGTGAKEATHVNITPEEVKTRSGEALEGVTAISGGTYYGLALLTSGKVDGWGRIAYGSRGGEIGEVESPEACAKERPCVKAAIQVAGLEDISAISAGEGYSLALSAGTIYGLGIGESGELGDGKVTNISKPQTVKGISGATEISAGVGTSGLPHSLALLGAGVTPPAALLSVTPGEHSLKLSWNLTTSEYEVKDKAWNPEECEEKAEGEEGHSGEEEEGEETPTEECKASSGKWLNTFKLEDVTGYELTGLVAETPYLVYLKAHTKDDNHKVRYIVGTPLA